MIRRVIAVQRDDPRAFRALVLRFAEHERDRGMGSASLSRDWRTIAALLGAIARYTGDDPCKLGKRPRTATRSMRGTGVADLVAELVADGRDRDAVIVGMLGELGMTDRAALAVRVRDAIDPRPTSPTFGASHTLAAAIDRVASTGAPGDPLLRGRRARGLSRAALYETLEHLGVSVAALQQSARVAMGAR